MTSLIRWGYPARALATRSDVDQLFDSLFDASRVSREWLGSFSPALDLEESKDEFVIRVDVPGIKQEGVKVSLLADTLTIRGERKDEEQRADRKVHRFERRYGSFERSFRLGVPVRADGVTATVRDGVLEVRVPKAEEAKTRDINVQAGS